MLDVKNDSELFDLIQKAFGIGDWSDDDERPWHKFRVAEISKIKAIRKKRGYSIADMVMLTEFCRSRGKTIKNTFDMLEFWPAAVRARTASERFHDSEDLQAAIEIERSRPDGEEWLNRLLLADGPGKAYTLHRWQNERKDPKWDE